MNTRLERFDTSVIMFLRNYADNIGRWSLALIFFWFGILKVFQLSPAGPLVAALMDATFLAHIDPDLFTAWFGVFEAILGVCLVFPQLERITLALLLFHMVTTVMPLFMVPEFVWDAPFVPNLAGQYIIKNAALLSLSLLLFARIKPLSETHHILAEESPTINT
jgi:uncharacterized membrane protein YkgB